MVVNVHTVVEHFRSFERLIPWIALALLVFIGGKMLWEGLHDSGDEESESAGVGPGALLVQGVATSIDALSVGFTIAEYAFFQALASALIIAAVTFVICMGGLVIGRKAGTALSGRAGVLGGFILIFIGVEIFITSFF